MTYQSLILKTNGKLVHISLQANSVRQARMQLEQQGNVLSITGRYTDNALDKNEDNEDFKSSLQQKFLIMAELAEQRWEAERATNDTLTPTPTPALTVEAEAIAAKLAELDSFPEPTEAELKAEELELVGG